MTLSLLEIARALGGEISRGQVRAPGPGHSPGDWSLSIRLSKTSPDGFLVHSFAGDDWRSCRDYVATALGMPLDRWRQNAQVDPAEVARRQEAQRSAEERHRAEIMGQQRKVLAIWEGAVDPRGTVVEVYLRSRELDLSDDVAGEVLRFHPHCPWGGSTVPAMVALFRNIRTGEITGLHRTALTPDGQKIGRKMLGRVAGAAIKLDADDVVTLGLHIGEGIETCLAARQLGLRPTWALGSVGAIQSFPLLSGLETLTVLAETGDGGASEAAAHVVGARWCRAGRTVDIIEPRVVGDLNDALRMEVSR